MSLTAQLSCDTYYYHPPLQLRKQRFYEVRGGNSLVIQWLGVCTFTAEARLQQYVNHEITDVKGGFRKCRGTRDQIANIRWIIEKAKKKQQKNIYFCFIDCAKASDCVDHNKLWKILIEMAIVDHLTCLLRNLCAGQEATFRTGHGTTDWFKIG